MQNSERRLFIPGYYAGFSNNKMSLDIAVILAYLTGRVLVPYRFRLAPPRIPVEVKPGRRPEPFLVTDLFEIPVPWSDEYLLKTWISVPGAHECAWAPVCDSVLCFPANLPRDDEAFRNFRNGRLHVHIFDEREGQAPDLHVNTLTLGHYSYFFYLDEAHRREVVKLMRRLRPKRPYREAADCIAAALGSFNAVHLRRGDFRWDWWAQTGLKRAASISGQEIVANLASRMDRNDPLVVCTDDPSHDELFGPIQKYFRDVIFLDRYLRENADVRQLVAQLPRDDDIVEILLSQLVASKARVFAGTMFSTFTALIHRLRGFARQEPNFLYCYNDFLSPFVRFERCEFLPVDDGPHSWNRVRYPVPPETYSWFRDWPESFDAVRPSAEEAPPSGTLDLRAGTAKVHGSGLRIMQDAGEGAGGEPVIGSWTDAGEFVAWDLQLAAGSTYAIEIRYACPPEFAGSRYRVGIAGGDEFHGRVWHTGGWTSRSPWLPLGRIRIPAGRSTLIVRTTEKASDFVMNLSGVRLTPMDCAA